MFIFSKRCGYSIKRQGGKSKGKMSSGFRMTGELKPDDTQLDKSSRITSTNLLAGFSV
jgi:hypothetical protein